MGIYSKFLKHIILPIGDLFFEGNYIKEIKKWKQYDTYSEEKLISIQSEFLENIMQEALNNVPFYIDNYREKLLKKEKLSIKDFPVLTKEILRSKTTSLISNKYKISDLEKNHSSGSSGTQSFTFMTYEHKFYLRALQTHWFNWSGYEEGEPIVQLGMSPKRILPKKLKDIFFRVTYLNSFFLAKDDLLQIAKKMNKKKIKYIVGYPSEMNEVAETIIANNLQYKLDGIVSFGDKLFDHYIDNFNKAFLNPSKIIDTYGCAEGILVACRKDLEYYYIVTPHVYIEIVDDDLNEVPDGEVGHVLVTCLTNKAMPIIRYKLGDMAAKLPKAEYPKNREFNYPLLKRVVGRDTDFVKLNDGTKIFVTTFATIMKYHPEIKQFKIIQEEHTKIVIEYTTDSNFAFGDKALIEIKEEIDKITSNSLDVDFKKVETISRTKSGKPQIIESKIK